MDSKDLSLEARVEREQKILVVFMTTIIILVKLVVMIRPA